MLAKRLSGDPICAPIARVVASRPSAVAVAPGRGLPIGSLVSQHLANLYLGQLDHWLCDGLGFGTAMRYMDDFLVFGERLELRALARRLPEFLAVELGLNLKGAGASLHRCDVGFTFLGCRLTPRLIRPSRASWRRLCDKHRQLERDLAAQRITEVEAARRAGARFAYAAGLATATARRRLLARHRAEQGGGLNRREPRDSGRILEPQPAQRAGCEPQQEPARQSQRQRGLSPRELGVTPPGLKSGMVGTDAPSPRTWRLYPDADPTATLAPNYPTRGLTRGPTYGLVRGAGERAQTAPPGGGLGVAAGRLLRGGKP